MNCGKRKMRKGNNVKNVLVLLLVMASTLNKQ